MRVQEKVGAELGVSLGDVEKDTLHSSHRLFAFPSAPVYRHGCFQEQVDLGTLGFRLWLRTSDPGLLND